VFVVTARRVFNHMKIIDLGTCKTGFPFFVLFVWLILSLPSQAQVAGGSLSGTVTDASGAAVAGAKVTIENLATGVSRDPTTDEDGFYTTPNLLPGTYEITVSAAGFATQVRKGLTLSVGGQSTVNLAPAPTWVSIQNTSTEPVSFVFIFSAAGFRGSLAVHVSPCERESNPRTPTELKPCDHGGHVIYNDVEEGAKKVKPLTG
jgi:hypothetical protein